MIFSNAFLAALCVGNLPFAQAGEATSAAATSAGADPPRVHDPSTIVRCADEYWLFSTGTGVLSRRSKDLVTWLPGPPVFSVIPPWVQGIVPGHRGHFWAPDVIRLRDRYFLYYSVSSWGKNTSAIALATNATLDPLDPTFAWQDEGVVLDSTTTNDFNAIDPAVFETEDRRLWMVFGSFWSGIKLVELDPATGRRLSPDSPLHALASHPQIEAAAVIARDDWHYLFVNWGFCCRGTNSTYEIRVGRSRPVTGPYLDREGQDLRAGGGTLFLESAGRMIGPGHPAFFSEGTNMWVSYHFYDRERRGAPTLGIRPLEWDAEGWPRAGERRSPAVGTRP